MVVLFLAAHEAPNFIALNIGHRYVSALALKQSLTAISYKYQNLHDRVLINASEPLNRTDRATLDQEIDNTFHFLGGRVHAAQMLIPWI